MTFEEEIETLIARVALADPNALRELYARVSPQLFGVALRLLRDRSEAEDVLQDVFGQIWDRAGQYRSNGLSPMTWLITMVRELAVETLRQTRSRAPMEELDLDAVYQAPNATALEALSAEYKDINQCFTQISPERATLIRKVYFEGLSYDEVAQASGIEADTLRDWLRRSLLQLRECLST